MMPIMQEEKQNPQTSIPTREKIIAAAKQACESRRDVLFAYLFGSHARGKTGPLSDIDLALYFDPRVPESRREKISGEAGDEIVHTLSLSGEYPLQIQVLNEIQETHRALEHDIVYNGIRIYSRDEAARAHYEAGAIHRWIDWLPRQEHFNKATLDALQKPVEPYHVYA